MVLFLFRLTRIDRLNAPISGLVLVGLLFALMQLHLPKAFWSLKRLD
jgi:hypothetical protein